MKVVINGIQVWPTEKSPKQFAFRSETNPEDGTVIYTEYALDSKGASIGVPTILIEMHPKQVQSICFSAQKFGSQKEEKSARGVRHMADSVLRKMDKLQ